MLTTEIVYKYKLEVNKLDSQDFVDLPLPTILSIINKGFLLGVNAIYGVDNILRQGIESTQLRIDDLQDLIIKDYEEAYAPLTNNVFISTLPDNYLHLLRSWSLADKGICKDRKLKNIEYSNDELNEILISKDPNRYPSFEWQELPINISQNKIWAYVGEAGFTPTKSYSTYLKYPTKIDLAGYEHFDGSPSTNVDSELEDYVIEQFITLIARFTKAILQDAQGYQILSSATAPLVR